MTRELQDAVARLFIQRKDVKAVQTKDIYTPERKPFTRDDLSDHLEGKRSLGHYLVGTDNHCKLFAFDIDLRKEGSWVGVGPDGAWTQMDPKPFRPREAWLHPRCPDNLRRYMIAQLRGVAEELADVIVDLISVPVAIHYSGGKGLHVYGFTGCAPARDVKEAALEVLRYTGNYEKFRGECFWRHRNDDPITGYPNVDVEVFPKQDTLDDKDLGNLMRLPLGVHRKTQQRAFFVGCASNIDSLPEVDALEALKGNPWSV